MDSAEHKAVGAIIDALLNNLVWAWNYFYVLEGLHEEFRADRKRFVAIPALTTCLWHALFDALILKSSQFIDRRKNVQSIYQLFQLVRRYRPHDIDLLKVIKQHERALDDPKICVLAIRRWRNEILAHATKMQEDSTFFEQNRLALLDIKSFLQFLNSAIEFYSVRILDRSNDTMVGAIQQKSELRTLLRNTTSS